jgi:dihydroneopterin aldolase
MTINDTILVYLRDCTVPLFVGLYDHEKPAPQPVIIDIEATAPLTHRYDDLKASNIALIIDYDRLYDFVTKVLPTLGHIPLLESVGERIIAFCFEDKRIHEVVVRIRKPEILQGKASVGIEMRRTRSPS